MIWSMSWVAVRRVHADELWRTLGLRPTGKTADARSCTFAAAGATEGEWAVVWTRGNDRLLDRALLAALLQPAEAVGCFVDEHALLSHTVCWRDGAPAWAVRYDGVRATQRLQTFGELPAAFHDLERQAVEARRVAPERRDVAFQVPIDLAKAVVGFRHDEGNGRVLHELEPVTVAQETSAVVALGSPADLARAGRPAPGVRSRGPSGR